MSILQALLAVASDPHHRDLEAQTTFAIDSSLPEERCIGILQEFFVMDEDNKVLGLEVDGKPAGVVTREMMLDLAADPVRNAAIADHLFLPGDSEISFVKLRCSAADCPREWIVAGGAAAVNPTCPDHPDAGVESIS